QQAATEEATQQPVVEEQPPASAQETESQASESSAASVPVPAPAQPDSAEQRSGNFRLVEIAGRSVPIPKNKPQRQ
ncbi:MAG: hypothetical protein AAF299_03430, partial [Pseudomonadota bacterium]